MCDSGHNQGVVDMAFTRRSALLALSSAAAASAMPACARARAVVERDVLVPTADGKADAALFYPAGAGPWPAVLMWPDIFGLRPVFREMGRRLAAAGYVVLVPNPFYRTRKAPVVSGSIDFNKPDDRAKLMSLKATLSDASVDRDTAAFIRYLDARKQTDKRKGMGVQGYCFSGPFAFQAAALRPERVRAVATFHGGGQVTDKPNSPHLLIPKSRAAYVVAIARNDDAEQPNAKTVLKQAFKAANRPATVEVYPADHGWTVPGSQTYNEAAAEKAWAELIRLYRARLG